MPFERNEANFEAGGQLATKAIEDETGDLIFEGLAAPITADDEDEAFEEKALANAIDEFMAGNRPLLYNHTGLTLGTVEHLEHRPGVGLWMKARVVKPEPGTEAADIFTKVKRGAIRGISTAGRFWRRAVADSEKSGDPLQEKFRIWKSRFREISLTPIPVHPDALGAVAQKSFADLDAETQRELTETQREAISRAVKRYHAAVSRVDAGLARVPAPSDPDAGTASD